MNTILLELYPTPSFRYFYGCLHSTAEASSCNRDHRWPQSLKYLPSGQPLSYRLDPVYSSHFPWFPNTCSQENENTALLFKPHLPTPYGFPAPSLGNANQRALLFPMPWPVCCGLISLLPNSASSSTGLSMSVDSHQHECGFAYLSFICFSGLLI